MAGTRMITAESLVRLMTWLSPAFPTGGFAYSHGLEWAVEAGDVRDAASLREWLSDVLTHGSGRSDAILLRHGWRARNAAELAPVAELAEAVAPCRERREEAMAQGAAFAAAASAWSGQETQGAALAYPVAVGVLAAEHGVGEDATVAAFLHCMTANLVSAAVRLVPLGQRDGLRVLAALERAILSVTEETRAAELDDIGGACFRSDLAAMRHETQYTRLFRT